MTIDEARENPIENLTPAEKQDDKKSAPQNEPVDPLGSGCGFIPGEGI